MPVTGDARRRRRTSPLAAMALVLLLPLLLLARGATALRRRPGTSQPTTPPRALYVDEYEAAGYRRLAARGLAADPTSPDEHLVTDLPGLAKDAFPTRQWAGLLTVDEATDGKFFYWFLEAATDAASKPLLIWLNGGPGCSSMDGFFLENGPFKVQEDLTLAVHPYSWHKAANVLYVDQPVGTGWSFTGKKKYCDDDACINRHMYAFLQSFLRLHKDLLLSTDGKSSRPVFFAGESQAGHYIPTMVDFILAQNKAKAADALTLNVQGMAIGNGWFDPPNQYDVSQYAHGAGMISEGQYHTLQKKRAECNDGLAQGRYFNPVCFSLLDEVVAATGTDHTGYVSLYDYRLFDNPGNRVFPPGNKTVEAYLNQASVKEALHASESPLSFQECTDPPYDHLKKQDGLGVMGEVGRILDDGSVRALFFNGAFDVICNHVGNEAALQGLVWTGQEDYHVAPRGVWMPEGKPGGYAKTSGPLTYLVVASAGHMVPLDVPSAALDMVQRFLAGKTFQDKPQGIAMSDVHPTKADPAVSAAGELDPTNPPQPPLLKAVRVADGGDKGAVELEVHGATEEGKAAVPVQQGKDLWYTVLVNPGGSLLLPTQGEGKDAAGKLELKDLKEGVEYSFQAVANTPSGASKPSEPMTLVLGCGEAGADDKATAAAATCHHGLCGFDAEGGAKRCFCYQGWAGAACDVAGAAGAADTPVAAADPEAPAPLGSGRVTFVVDQSCAGADVPSECALRFTVPLRLIYEDQGTETPPQFGSLLDGPDETKAFEGMLRRDLSNALGIQKEQVQLRSLHPLNSSYASSDAGGALVVVDDDDATADTKVGPMALTFDLLSAADPPTTVQLFTTLWSAPKSPLRFGLVTSNFDVSRNAEVLLLARDTPLADLPAGGVLADKPAQRSLLVSFSTFALIGLVLLVLIRLSKRKLGAGGRRVGGGNGAGASSLSSEFHHRRGDTMEPDFDERLDGDDDDDAVEIMEVRSSTDSQGSRSGSMVRLAGLGIGSGGAITRATTVDDGSNERLV